MQNIDIYKNHGKPTNWIRKIRSKIRYKSFISSIAVLAGLVFILIVVYNTQATIAYIGVRVKFCPYSIPIIQWSNIQASMEKCLRLCVNIKVYMQRYSWSSKYSRAHSGMQSVPKTLHG